MTFLIALIGRPNVGKSTLFNRLVGRRLALVDDMPGLTRDRREGEARLGNLKFRVLDTAGLDIAEPGSLAARMSAQTEQAIAEADLCLFLIDARAGVTGLDKELAGSLRKSECPVVVIANKCEGRAAEAGFYESYALGLGEPVAISAEHGEGLGELIEVVAPYMAAAGDRLGEDGESGPDKPVRLVVV
ncbi:MAG: GTPase, partial [Hyphomicrobiales bacterium]